MPVSVPKNFKKMRPALRRSLGRECTSFTEERGDVATVSLQTPTSSTDRLLRAASIGTILALLLMIWSLIDPRPMPVVVAMSVGQLLGTLSLATFIFVVAKDLRRAASALRAGSAEAPSTGDADNPR